MRALFVPVTVFGLAFASASSASAQARTFEVQRDSRAEFVSDAPLETMHGRSSQLSGELRIDPSDLSSARGTITMPVSSLRTGIDLRDEHLRSDDWLDAERHPNITFEITRVEGARQLQSDRATRLRLHGRFTAHGVTRNVVASANVRLTGNDIRGRASFTIQLTDYNISVPLPVRLKVSNEIRVNVTIHAAVD